ncbi:MAG TPA: exodeoxyribonuclease V subunit alpha [Nocardioidaceae bacterium]|nr:exodeoxyribonuclease V subunit alpha [Nocardioidaceae bacterium]
MTTTLGHEAAVARNATGVLRTFCEAGVLQSADVHVATRLGRLGAESSEEVLLAVALAVRAVRHGSVCLDLAQVRATIGIEDADEEALAKLAALEWPELSTWRDALAASPLVGAGSDPAVRPLRLSDDLLYLDRYWRQELVVAEGIDERRGRPPVALDAARLAAAVGRLFPDQGVDRQRLATVVAAHRWMSVLAGGPGTGKTTTVAKLLAVLRDQPDGDTLRIALAAPTGKAAARLEEAVTRAVAGFTDPADRERLGALQAMTLHRLLGWKPGARTRFKHDREHRLPYDVVVVDEASMVSLTLMARLVEALRDDARLVLVGDPDQLASVEAGAVLGDLVRRPAPAATEPLDVAGLLPAEAAELGAAVQRTSVVTLTRVHRVDEATSDITALARAINAGDADAVLELLTTGTGVELVPTDGLDAIRADVVDAGVRMTAAARAGDGRSALEALDRHRVLCAHRLGPFGVAQWSHQVEEWLREAVPDFGSRDLGPAGGLWYVGRPLLVMSNDPVLQLYNGDTGVVVDVGGQPRAVFARGAGLQTIATNRLAEVTTLHAMSVHKSQGSEFERVTVVLPEATSPLLTKELFYTAVTRAKQHVRVLGGEDSVRAAVGRRIQRASGLARGVPSGG